MKKLVIIDGQGGKLGSQLVDGLIKAELSCDITAIGTNSLATAAMIKAGARNAATGENPVVVACRNADLILGPIGIISADSLLGEITPAMACAVGQSSAVKILLPVSKCDNLVVGVKNLTIAEMIREAVSMAAEVIRNTNEA